MVILGLSDIHGDITGLSGLAEKVGQVDLVLVSGDLTNFGGRAEAARVIGEIRRYFPDVLAVAGNCDEKVVEDYLRKEGLSLHGQTRFIQGIGFMGIGFSLPCPVYTPGELTEGQLQALLASAYQSLPEKTPFLLLAHQPPFGTRLDLVRSGRHVGSQAVRTFIEEKKPVVCLCGHIHEASGKDELGPTLLINPGPLRHGGFVVLEVTPSTARIRDCGWPTGH